MKFFIMLVFTVSLFFFSDVSAKTSEITYVFKSTEKWKRDLTTESLAPGDEHYTLEGDDTIDILFSFDQQNHFQTIKTSGATVFFQQIMKGKNLIHNLVSDEPIKALKVKASDQGERQVISFETDYKFGDVKYNSIEKYFVYENQSLVAVLRWNQKSDLQKLKAIQSDFEKIVVKRGKDNK